MWVNEIDRAIEQSCQYNIYNMKTHKTVYNTLWSFSFFTGTEQRYLLFPHFSRILSHFLWKASRKSENVHISQPTSGLRYLQCGESPRVLHQHGKQHSGGMCL